MRIVKIIDFARKGNLVRFFLGADDCMDYTGDDWNDAPYDCNSEIVDSEYITGYRDIGFPFDSLVLEPCDGFLNTPYSKDDMKYRNVPCIVVVPKHLLNYKNYNFLREFDPGVFAYYAGSNDPDIKKFYFGDHMEPRRYEKEN